MLVLPLPLGPTITPICQGALSRSRSASSWKLAPVSTLNRDLTRAALDKQRHYLAGVRDGIRGALADKRTIADAVETLASTGTDGWLLTEDFHRRNLTAAYAELEWED